MSIYLISPSEYSSVSLYVASVRVRRRLFGSVLVSERSVETCLKRVRIPGWEGFRIIHNWPVKLRIFVKFLAMDSVCPARYH